MIFHTPPLNIPLDAANGFNQCHHFACYLNGEVSIENVTQLMNATIYNKEAFDHSLITDFISTHKDCRDKLCASAQSPDKLNEVDYLKNREFGLAIFSTEHDPFTNINYIKNLKLKLWKDDLVCIKNSGHYPQLENPNDFNKELLQFLNEKM